jgi:pimeloyl-ACP methyl ester carboxylesterase
MSVIELTTFTVKPEQTAAMLAARPGMVDAFRRDRRGFAAGRPDAKVPVARAVSIAGVLDIAAADADKFGSVLTDLSAPEPAGAPPATRPELAPIIADHMGEGAVHYLLGGHREEVPERYAAVAPGISIPVLSIRGTADDVVPAKYTAHPAAEHAEVPGANHFDVIDPNHPTWDIVRKWLA